MTESPSGQQRGVENKTTKTLLLACNWLMLLPHWCIIGPIHFSESNQHLDIENMNIIMVFEPSTDFYEINTYERVVYLYRDGR